MIGEDLTGIEKMILIRSEIDAKNGSNNDNNPNSSENKTISRIGDSFLKVKSQYNNNNNGGIEYSPKIGTWILNGALHVLNGKIPTELLKNSDLFKKVVVETSLTMGQKKYNSIEGMINSYLSSFKDNANKEIKNSEKITIDPEDCKEVFEYLKNPESKEIKKKEDNEKSNDVNNGGYKKIALYINEKIHKWDYENGLEALAKDVAKSQCMKVFEKYKIKIKEDEMVKYIISALCTVKEEIDKFDDKYFKEKGGVDISETLSQYAKYRDMLALGKEINNKR